VLLDNKTGGGDKGSSICYGGYRLPKDAKRFLLNYNPRRASALLGPHQPGASGVVTMGTRCRLALRHRILKEMGEVIVANGELTNLDGKCFW